MCVVGNPRAIDKQPIMNIGIRHRGGINSVRMHWEPEFKEGCADKCVSSFIDLQNAVTKPQKDHWTGINDQKEEREMFEFKVFN